MLDGDVDGELLAVGVGVGVGVGDGGGDDDVGADDVGGEKCEGEEPDGFGFGEVPGSGMPTPTEGCGASEFFADRLPLWCPWARLPEGELVAGAGPAAGMTAFPP
jgi:hypothetical protein